MAAGLGFKDFTTGEVLTAADVDGYLMQGVWVFASAAARDAAVTSPQEGNFAYLKDTNVTTYYTGSAWANLDTTGMTNPMTTAGDTIYGGASGTPTRLAIGSTGNVLTVSGGNPVWAAPASSGGITLISNTVASSSTGISFSSLGSYKQLLMMWDGLTASGNGQWGLRLNNDSATNYYIKTALVQGSAAVADLRSATHIDATYGIFGQSFTSTTFQQRSSGYILIDNYTDTSLFKNYQGFSGWRDVQFSTDQVVTYNGSYNSTSAVTSLDIVRLSGTATISNATDTSIRLYGIS